MKTYISILCLLLVQSLISQDRLNETFNAEGINKIKLSFEYGDVTIEAWDKNEIELTGEAIVNGKQSNKLVNLNKKTTGENFRLDITLDIDENDRQQIIRTKDGKKLFLQEGQSIASLNLDCDDLSIYQGTDLDAQFLLKLPRRMLVDAKMKYGSYIVSNYFKNMEVKSTYGSVTVDCQDLPDEPKMIIESTYGLVDVSLPQRTNADLRIETEYGNIYTNLEFTPDYNPGRGDHGEKINAKLNNGGHEVFIKSGYSNVFLRKPSL